MRTAPVACVTAAGVLTSFFAAAQSYTCSTDMATLTGGNPQYAGQTLANYCESTCGGCGASGAQSHWGRDVIFLQAALLCMDSP
jgi:hypothetical protein